MFIALLLCVLLKGFIYPKNPKQIPCIAKEDNAGVFVLGEIYKITKAKDKSAIWIKNSYIEKDSKSQNTGKIIAYTEQSDENFSIGNEIKIYGKIHPLERAHNEGEFDSFKYYFYTFRVNFTVSAEKTEVIDDSKSYIKNGLYCLKKKMCHVIDDTFIQENAGILKAMMYGEKAYLDDDIKEKYAFSGISHILAISGLHVSILGNIIYGILYKVTSSLKISTVSSIIFIILYGIMTDFSVSTNRAVVMMCVMMIGKMIGRSYDMITALALSGIIIIMMNPYQIYSAGFILSFLAILALALFLPCIHSIIGYEKNDAVYLKQLKLNGEWYALKNIYPLGLFLVRKVLGLLLSSLSVNILTWPVILWMKYEISFLSIFINILVIPLMTIVVGMTFLACIIGLFSTHLALFCAGSVHYILKLINYICDFAHKSRLLNVLFGKPHAYEVIIYYILVVGLTFILLKQKDIIKKKINIIWTLSLYVLLFVIVFAPSKDNKLHIDMLSVGQGESIFIELPDSTTMLVDGGSTSKNDIGKNIILPYMKYNAIKKIDYAVISHPDDDHVSGIIEIIENDLCVIGSIILPKIEQKNEKFNNIVELAKKHNIEIMYLSRGDTIKTGQVLVESIHPYEDIEYESDNDYSQVFLLRYNKFGMVFTGDISENEEKDIINYSKKMRINLKCDILKAAHHGSNGSGTTEFINLINPKTAVISAGKNNIYSHPGKELLRRLEDNNIQYYVTKDNGQISMVSDGCEYEIECVRQ